MMKILGLQIDQPYLKAAVWQKGKVISLKSALLANPGNVKRIYIPKFRGRIVTGLSSKDFILRSLELNIAKSRHLKKALQFQSEGTTHLDPNETISIPYSIKKLVGKVEVNLIAAPKTTIQKQLEDLKKLQINPDCMSANALALKHFVLWKKPALQDVFVVDLGSDVCTCISLEKGELKKSHAIALGAHSSKDGDEFSSLRQELSKVIFSFQRLTPKKPIIFTGNALPHLKTSLCQDVQDAITEEISLGAGPEELSFAIPIGLCIQHEKAPLQLLRNEFFPRKNYTKAGSYAAFLLFLSIFLSTTLFFIGNRSIRKNQEKMMEEISPIMQMWGSNLTLLEWKKEVAKNSKEYPYILDVPNASSFLSWLHQFTILADDPLQLLDIQYTLESQDPYVAKVELQFQMNSPLQARKFHVALLEDNEMIDNTKEISWEDKEGSYLTRFYLKKIKSPYVP